MRHLLLGCVATVSGAASLLAFAGPVGNPAAAVDARAIGLADEGQVAADWLSHGRTYGERRYSPLDAINATNVARLGLAWEFNLESPRIGIQATPVVANGVLYVTSSFSRVYALDARTGAELWRYDPRVSADAQLNGCCKAVNRGVALWKGKVYVAALDGRLIALDAATGARVWEVDTVDGQPRFSITGAPIVAGGRVVIGNGGADIGARGHVSAYDAETGRRLWRFHIVPGEAKQGYPTADVAFAAKTWSPTYDWAHPKGGSGGAWNAISYDPEADLVYIGTGNRDMTDPPVRADATRVGTHSYVGDDLYTASIVALHGATGRIAWYYQTTPGDVWDFDAAQNMVLADLSIGGRPRKVLLQANKNGFFYVLDRRTGALLSAQPFVRVNWASRVDLQTGRPVLTETADYTKVPRVILPSINGAHNWMGMSISARTGLVYIPVRDSGFVFNPKGETWFMNGYDLAKLTPDLQRMLADSGGALLAWDPVAQKRVWSYRVPTFTNSGVLSTGGGLVVYGTQDGYLRVFSDTSGQVLKEFFIGTGMVAPPISYAVSGVQYIAIAAGWAGFNPNLPAADEPDAYDNAGRLIVLGLDGGPVPVAPRKPRPPLMALTDPQPAALVDGGLGLYLANCAICHGFIGENTQLPDLRRLSPASYAAFREIVLEGAFRATGMPAFGSRLTAQDADALRAFLVDWAQRTRQGLPRRGFADVAPAGDRPHL